MNLDTPKRTAEMRAQRNASIETRHLNLALQGGGAHGAFTWGVLDRLLEDERLVFDGISATSAGAMNATVMVYGYQQGGRAGARAALGNFWRRIAHAAAQTPFQATWWDKMVGNQALGHSPAFAWLDYVTRVLSPYQLNPLNWNPLRDVLTAAVDFEAMRKSKLPIQLFLCATNVRSGKVKVFAEGEISADSVLASCCLPFLFKAVEIDGEAYWDGGYMGNPAIFPADLQLRQPGYHGRAHQPDDAQGTAGHRRRDPEPHQRDQLQLFADAGDAGDQFRHPADR